MYARRIRQNLLAALDDSPVVLVNGARQTGKSTLIQDLGREATYYTFDDPAVLAAVQADPFGFVNALKGAVCLDEVQRAPGKFLAIKAAVDRVQPEGAKAMPRTLYEAWRKAVKPDHPDPGAFTATQRKRVAVILKELKQQAAEPGAAFQYTPEALAHLAQQVATRWDELAAMVKDAKGKKLPPVPDLDALSWHIPAAVKLVFACDAEATGKAKAAGW